MVELDFDTMMIIYLTIIYYLFFTVNNYTPIHVAHTSTTDETFDPYGRRLDVSVFYFLWDRKLGLHRLGHFSQSTNIAEVWKQLIGKAYPHQFKETQFQFFI